MINVVSVPLSNTMHESSVDHPPEADEFEKIGLTSAPSEVVSAPRVGEARVSVECVLERAIPLGADTVVIGRVVRFHVSDDLYTVAAAWTSRGSTPWDAWRGITRGPTTSEPRRVASTYSG